MRTEKNLIWTAILVFALAVSLVQLSWSLGSSRSISTSGSIMKRTEVSVAIDLSKRIGTNSLSLGFMVDHDWKSWRTSNSLRDLARTAGFKLIRIFDWRAEGSSPDPCIYWNEEAKTGTFNWTDVDSVVEGIFDVGAEPLICLGYYGDNGANGTVPRGMTIDPITGLPFPESFSAYAAEWANHFKQNGLPANYYEIFNEPAHYYNWGGSNTTRVACLTDLFNACYLRIHQINPNALVGTDSSNFKRVLDYFADHAVGLDFISMVHSYCSKSLDDPDSAILQKAEQIGFQSSGSVYSGDDARQAWYNARGILLPIIVSETNLSFAWNGGTDPRIQQVVGVVCHALQVRMAALHGFEYLLYYRYSSSKIKGERSQTGGYGSGMVNSDNNQPWYPYYLMKMVSNNLQTGDVLLNATSDSDDIRVLAWVHGTNLNILLICKVDQPRAARLRGLQGELAYTMISEAISWETPSVQPGKIDAANPLSLEGYSVILLQQPI